MLGLALFNSFHVDISLANIIFKNLLDEKIELFDLKYVDVAMYNGLKWLL
jgi:hypothetical protein